MVSAAVTDGTRKACGSYWNRVVEQWGTRRIDEPTPSEIKQLVAYVRAHTVPRRNARGGRSAAENVIAALRCLYKCAEEDEFIDERDNPARLVGGHHDRLTTGDPHRCDKLCCPPAPAACLNRPLRFLPSQRKEPRRFPPWRDSP